MIIRDQESVLALPVVTVDATDRDEAHEAASELDEAVGLLDEVARIDEQYAHACVAMREDEARRGVHEIELVVDRGLQPVREQDETALGAVRHVDGRRPDFSVGMTLHELARLCDRLGLRNALNLDGGGSTTLVVKGVVVNRPTDLTGPRAVSDAIVATLR